MYEILPEGYQQIDSIDLQHDQKLSIMINGLAIIVMVVMILIMVPFHSLGELYDVNVGFVEYVLKWAVLGAGMILYIILHELVHGITMKYMGTKKVNYGFTGLYAYAGSKDYYNKKSYIIIALAPIVVWGIVLLILNLLVSSSWFYVVYLIQVCNLSGAAGDLYVTYRFSNMPEDILVQDTGVSMRVYGK